MKTLTINDFKELLKAGSHTFPGIYPKYFITKDCEVLSFKSALENRELIIKAMLSPGDNTQWEVVACEVNYENESLFCSHSNEKIESAYGE